MEWTPHWSPRASSDTVSCSFSYHTWQFIIITITACIISYSPRISFWTQDLALQQILSSIDLFLFYLTDYTDSRTMLNGCTGKCVGLSWPLVGFWTHFKSLHFHSFIHSFRRHYWMFTKLELWTPLTSTNDHLTVLSSMSLCLYLMQNYATFKR